MAIAYVLINTETGKEIELLRELKENPGVVEANLVYGEYDIVVKVKARDVPELNQVVLTKIRRLKYIRSTVTMIAPLVDVNEMPTELRGPRPGKYWG